MNIELIRDDITNMSVDAVVLPANQYLMEGSGVSSAIFNAAGRRNLREACRRIGYCEVGNAVTTSAFAMDADYIVHAVVPKWIDGIHNEYELLEKTYNSALKEADRLECRSIAFPVLAVGNNGFSRSVAVRIAVDCIKNYDSTNLNKAVLVVYSQSVYDYMMDNDYKVEIGRGFQLNAGNYRRKENMNHVLNEGKKVARGFIGKVVQVGIDMLNDEKVQRKIIDAGLDLIKSVGSK